MNRRILVDARLLHVNRAGIGRYLVQLYRAMDRITRPVSTHERGRDQLDKDAGDPPDLAVLYHLKDRERALAAAWPGTVAFTPPHHPLERWTLAAEVAWRRPALFHAPDHVCPQPLGWRTVLTVHDLAFRRLPESHTAASRAYYAGLDRSVRQAQRVICVSDATRRDLLASTQVDPAKVRVVYEAPDPRYTPHGPAATGPRPYFVFVGTLEPRKNLALLFQALALLPRAARPELRLAGAVGPGGEALAALPAALDLAADVRFLGRVPDDEVAALYRGALALVYPSLLEGFGLPVLEAMASGTPVITADRSSLAEVAGGAAALVDPLDATALAGAMARVVESQAYRDDLRARGLARAAQFSWERAARETLAVFHEALAA